MEIKYFFYQRYPNILIQHPDPVLKKLKNAGYHKCWAHQFSILNRFYFRSFFDYDFTLLPSKEGTVIKLNDPKLTETLNYITAIETDKISEDKPVIQLFPSITFFSDKKCFIELQQSFNSPAKIISGKYDIAKWTRPVQPSFEIEYHQRIKISRGDILCEIVFYTEKINESIKLKWLDKPDQSLLQLGSTNTLVSKLIRKTKSLINNE